MKCRVLVLVPVLALTGCAADKVAEGGSSADVIVIGSQDYYSNEIVAEIYAQALENEGLHVDRQFRSGQREVYVPELEAKRIDVVPEYTGALLQYYAPDTKARQDDDVYAELQDVIPDDLQVLDAAEASDQDAYVVRSDDPARSLADLAGRSGLKLGANSEIERRPFGPEALRSTYGVDVSFTPIEDSGGPLTVRALLEGDIDLANIYTASPALADGQIRALEDPEGIFVSSHLVPLTVDDLPEQAVDVLNWVSSELDQQDLLEMNVASVDEQKNASVIAEEWLDQHGR